MNDLIKKLQKDLTKLQSTFEKEGEQLLKKANKLAKDKHIPMNVDEATDLLEKYLTNICIYCYFISLLVTETAGFVVAKTTGNPQKRRGNHDNRQTEAKPERILYCGCWSPGTRRLNTTLNGG